MTGRTRRSSAKASSVDPIQYSQEASVLRKPPPDLPDINWQSFELNDATIFNKDGKTLENALDVIVNGPFVIRGILKLETEDHEIATLQKAQLISKVKPSGRPLEIRESRQLSVGEMGLPEDADPSKALGDPVLWMRGRGAWYEINPSRQYTVMYRKACQSIRLYYGILTIYEATCDGSGKVRPSRVEGKKSSTGIERLQDIFFKYALKAGNGMTIEEVEQHCDEAAPLFIQWFLEAKDQPIWEPTYFRRWMMRRHENLFKKMSQAVEQIQKAASSSSFQELPMRKRTKSKTPIVMDEPVETTSRKRSTRSGSPVIPSTLPGSSSSGAAARRPQSKDSRSSVGQNQIAAHLEAADLTAHDQVMTDAPEGAESTLGSLLVALENVHGQIYPKRALTLLAVASKLYPAYKWPTFKNGKSGCHKVPIEEVLHYNASALLGKLDAEKWQGEFYDWLKKMSKTKLTLEALKPSDLPYMVVPRGSKPFTPRTQQVDQVASSTRIDQSQIDDHDDSNEFETPRRPGRGIKTPARQGKSTLRPIASSYKRDFEELESDSEEESPVAKRAHYDDDDDDDDDVVKEQEALSSDEDDKIKLVIRADKIPSTAPQGRDGTWICDEEDCNYVVRGGDAESCQERIEAHFSDHKQQGERMQLAMTEGTRGHLPINHLLQKIQHLGEKVETREKKEEEEEFGMALPKPIKRRLLV